MTEVKQNSEKSIGFSYVKSLFYDIIDLRKGVDKKAVIQEIKAKKSMAGANAWMLMCSILIASIGLDRNSDAVIIGAMLISPLMSPILGIGLGIGINDKEVLKKSFIHFSAAILIALVTSTVYFALTPFGNITPAIHSRTEPNTLDVLVAIFGGLAGIISIARKDISVTLPGVAIATALMPPLCVTGYGIAKGDPNFALSAFYLFMLNTSFISIATYIIVRFLRFPYRRYLKRSERVRNRIIVLLFGLLIVIPSFYILGRLLQKQETENIIAEFIDKEFGEDRIFLDDYKTLLTDTSSTLVLYVYGDVITSDKQEEYKSILSDQGLTDLDVRILNSSESDINTAQVQSLEQEIQKVKILTQEKKKAEAKKIELLQQSKADSLQTLEINAYLVSLFPPIESVSYGKMQSPQADGFKKIHTVIVYKKKGQTLTKTHKEQLSNFLKVKFKGEPYELLII